MAPTLYMIAASPPVRSVLLCGKALGLDLEMKVVDLFAGENLTQEYLKMNPLHTVPTLDDDGFYVCDSHAIMTYLTCKYGKDKSLYPEDLTKRTLVDQRLHFDSSKLFIRGVVISRSILFHGAKEVNEEKKKALLEAYDFVEKFLESSDWVAGDFLSLADFSIITSITSWDKLVPVEDSRYPRIKSWWKRMEQLPYYKEANIPGLNDFENFVKKALQSE